LVSDTTINIVKANKSEYKYDLSIYVKRQRKREKEREKLKYRHIKGRISGNRKREVYDPEKLSPRYVREKGRVWASKSPLRQEGKKQ